MFNLKKNEMRLCYDYNKQKGIKIYDYIRLIKMNFNKYDFNKFID